MKRTDFSQLQGIENVKRAIEVCLAGYHQLHILSRPGNGNSTLVYAITNILKDLHTRNKEWYFNYNGASPDFELIDFYYARDGAYLKRGYIRIEVKPCATMHRMAVQSAKILVDHYFTDSACEASENVVERVANARSLYMDTMKADKNSITLLRKMADIMDLNIATVGHIHEVASTIAILDSTITIRTEHMAEAIQFFAFNPEDHA